MEKEKNVVQREVLTKDIIDLVIARLKTIPNDAVLSVGSDNKGGISVRDLIEHVRAGDEIGRKIVQVQLHFLRSLKDLPIDENVPAHN